MSACAIILAGGGGTRMGGEINKVLLSINGVPAIVRAIAPFTALIDSVVLVVRPCDEAEMRALIFSYGLGRVVTALVHGGDTRQASVYAGLCALPESCDTVLIHDGARAMVTEPVISRVLDSVREKGSGVAAIQATDTIRQADEGGKILGTLARESLFQMQTPQGFPKDVILKAHEKAHTDGYLGTDDAALVERLGLPVYLCQGDRENIKLTRPADLALCSLILGAREE